MIRLFLLVLFIFSSSSAFAFTPSEGVHRASYQRYFQQQTAAADKKNLQRRIMSQYAEWKGTDYRWGGDSRKGIDCSAFTRRVMASVIHKDLPRTAVEQSHMGISVNRARLKAGDLVFFMTRRNVRHVGVFIGNDKFIHASSSRGVTLSSLSSRYWQARYLTARRVSS